VILSVHKDLGAMKLKMKEIILIEQRPFSFADFREFEVCDKNIKWGMELSGIISQDSRKEEKWSEHSSPDLLSIVYQAKNSKK
jgi:hypothetical protein